MTMYRQFVKENYDKVRSMPANKRFAALSLLYKKEKIKEHAKTHSEKHMKIMKNHMDGGDTFNQAHLKALSQLE